MGKVFTSLFLSFAGVVYDRKDDDMKSILHGTPTACYTADAGPSLRVQVPALPGDGGKWTQVSRLKTQPSSQEQIALIYC